MTFFSHLAAAIMRHARVFLRVDPARDWIILLVVALLAFSGIVAWNAWIFQVIASGESIGGARADAPAAFDRTSLITVQSIFNKRADEEEKYISGEYTFTDPSQVQKPALK